MANEDGIKKVKELAVNLPEEQREALLAALASMDSDGDGTPDAVGIKAFWTKNGKFSKTAFFAVAGNAIVLLTYFVQSWFVGTTVDLSILHWTIPSFDAGGAGVIMGLLNGSYLGSSHINNIAEAKAAQVAG